MTCTYIGPFSFFTKKKKHRVFGTYFACFSSTNYEAGACDLYRKIVPKHIVSVKNENDPMPMYKSGRGPKWCFLDDGDAQRSKKHLFFQMSWHIEASF